MSKKAFLVGINDYLPSGDGGPDLNGCVNDVKDMANTLVICGFDAKDIKICTNKRATKEGILKGLNWLINKAVKGDSLVFYYSGHGSQVADIDNDETDKKDEIICPADIDFGENAYISDDDFKKIFSKLPEGVNLEVMLDSCFSGTATRDVKSKSRYLCPPIDYSFKIDYQPQLKTTGLLKRKPSDKNPVIVKGLNHVLWSGCSDNQTSEETEIDGNVRGVFTYNFCQILRRSNGNIKRSELYKLLIAAVKREGYEQTPQLELSSEELRELPFR